MAVTNTDYTKHFSNSLETLYGAVVLDLGDQLVASLPTASEYTGSVCNVTDAAGGATICRSDGTNWKIIAVIGATVS